MEKKIQIRIFPDGTVQAEVDGIKGKTCRNYIKIIEELLEAKTIDSNYTPEYYESEILNQESESKDKVVRRVM